MPQVTAPAGGWEEGTLADYLGLPTKVEGISVSALPGRAYGLIYNEWFRNQNVTQPTLVEVTDATTTGKNDGSATNDSAITLAKPLKAAKVFDYYTGALPEPQKGEPVTLPLGGVAEMHLYKTEDLKERANDPGGTFGYLGKTILGNKAYTMFDHEKTIGVPKVENIS